MPVTTPPYSRLYSDFSQLPSRLTAKSARKTSLILSVLALFSASFSSISFAAPVFDKTQGSDLVFKDGAQTIVVKTAFPNPEFKTLLGGENGLPRHVIYEAKSCEKCPEDVKSLYLQRLDGRQKPMQFVYPGKVVDPKKGLVFESRAFYGQCLPKIPVGYVVHQREHVGRRGWQRSVFVAQITPDGATEQLIERRLPTVTTTLQLVKRKVCTEIPGKSRSVLRRPLDLTPHQGMDDEDGDDEDDEEKPEIKGDTAKN